ncbi:TetR/AcrR family transcriptional regulator [Emcibacter nanhaiensis]|uniref:TetR/AcrR family transcriptional regulator n=1 Tax=Emcibacter nanhaiensis TaxID=1505037 RepID=A0A501PNX4_9PROT|nr:TetR/AcrR family transcriptional regulator [Emcibacter nanhaiensis]TPD61955.1 TetR/AcrR family transcriptional regulator [Emcibacter nanhaiensis]
MASSDAREKLLTAAEKIIISQGVSSATLRHIASEAGLNSALVSYYFSSLSGLIREVAHQNVALMMKAWEEKSIPLEQAAEVSLAEVMEACIGPLWISAAFNPSERALLVLDEVVSHGDDSIRSTIMLDLSENFDRICALVQKAVPHFPPERIRFRMQFVSSGCLGVPPRSAARSLFGNSPPLDGERDRAMRKSVEAAIACFAVE